MLFPCTQLSTETSSFPFAKSFYKEDIDAEFCYYVSEQLVGFEIDSYYLISRLRACGQREMRKDEMS